MVMWADADQSVSATTWSAVEFDTVRQDAGDWYDTTNFEWTPTYDGLYIHNVQVKFSGADEYAQFRFYDVTGTATLFEVDRIVNGDDGRSAWWQWQWWCEGGNTYTVEIYTASASLFYADTYLMITGPFVT
jgi:hypothetical protein